MLTMNTMMMTMNTMMMRQQRCNYDIMKMMLVIIVIMNTIMVLDHSSSWWWWQRRWYPDDQWWFLMAIKMKLGVKMMMTTVIITMKSIARKQRGSHVLCHLYAWQFLDQLDGLWSWNISLDAWSFWLIGDGRNEASWRGGGQGGWNVLMRPSLQVLWPLIAEQKTICPLFNQNNHYCMTVKEKLLCTMVKCCNGKGLLQ